MPTISFILNPKRKNQLGFKEKLVFYLKYPFTYFALWCGFMNIDYCYVHGDKRRLKIGNNCSTMNTLFNVISGTISIGDNTLFTHNCMVLTGVHKFHDGQLASLSNMELDEVPSSGNDIVIGSGCFVGSGSIILSGVILGDNVIVAAGSVVTKSFPNNVFIGGVPAKIIKHL